MSDYIKREDALEAIVDERTHTILQAWINVKKTVPSIDAVEVVRCKECKYWIDNCDEDDDLFRECRWRDEEMPDADDYCSYGERSK